MKYTTIAVCSAIALTATMAAESPAAAAIIQPSNMTPKEALEVAQSSSIPSGVTLTGTVEPLKEPPMNKKELTSKDQDHDNKEWFGRGYGGWGGLGGWGGYGGFGGWGGYGAFGAFRFGYSCGGISGWAYPLGYWNAFGSGLYGGGCGLGYAWGGLYYC